MMYDYLITALRSMADMLDCQENKDLPVVYSIILKFKEAASAIENLEIQLQESNVVIEMQEVSITKSGEVANMATDIIHRLKELVKRLTSERNEAVDFIKYIDSNYSGYMNEDERFEKWRGIKEREG